MELVVFDLDGTLLNRAAEISDYTKETLHLLRDRGVAYTVATGRTLHATRDVLAGHHFVLPQIYKNGVMIWRPQDECYTRAHLLEEGEIRMIIEHFYSLNVTPFIFTLDQDDSPVIYHTELRSDAERTMVEKFWPKPGLRILPASQLPAAARITNISALGPCSAINSAATLALETPHLMAYMGEIREDGSLCWIDVHHVQGSKGGAIQELKQDLGVSRVICFGDSDNDLSMFEQADESYAPDNARQMVKQAATAVIGHHDEEGIALFLRQRFGLPGCS